mmetsp:Transcript_9296/g.13742  ORF Transcript_9296/g.13742 Transcript_9296/m.13742 type:complete len:266 (-) Transcript_9296:503-1300(-)
MRRGSDYVSHRQQHPGGVGVDHAFDDELMGLLCLLPSTGRLHDASALALCEGLVQVLQRGHVEAESREVGGRWHRRVFLEGERLVEIFPRRKMHHRLVLLDCDRSTEELLVEFAEKLGVCSGLALNGEVAECQDVCLHAARLAPYLVDELLTTLRCLGHDVKCFQERVDDLDGKLSSVDAVHVLAHVLDVQLPISHSHVVVGCLDVVYPDPDFTRPPVRFLVGINFDLDLGWSCIQPDLVVFASRAGVEAHPRLVERPCEGAVLH